MIGPAITLADISLGRPRSGFELAIPALSIGAGEVLAILGPSGCGKSTLLQILGLLTTADKGTVAFDGDPVSEASAHARSRVAAVFQRPYLFKGTVRANVEYGLKVRGMKASDRERRVAEELDRVGLAGYQDRSVAGLSGGEAQRVSLARALAVRPSLLLLDEPLASLDPLLKRTLTTQFAKLVRGTGATVVWVTHDQSEALVVADSVAVMREGRVIAVGPAESTLSMPADDWTSSFLGVERAMEGVVSFSDGAMIGIEVGDTEVWVTGCATVGARVRWAVRPEDVTLIEVGEESVAMSARNRIETVVTELEHVGATFLVRLDAGGVRLAATVSRASVRELGLEPGVKVVAAFKATAVSWQSLDGDVKPMDI